MLSHICSLSIKQHHRTATSHLNMQEMDKVYNISLAIICISRKQYNSWTRSKSVVIMIIIYLFVKKLLEDLANDIHFLKKCPHKYYISASLLHFFYTYPPQNMIAESIKARHALIPNEPRRSAAASTNHPANPMAEKMKTCM